MGVDINLERLPLSQIISTDALPATEELVFNIETPFSADDLVLTLELIEGEARRLLASLKDFRHSRSYVRNFAETPMLKDARRILRRLTMTLGQCYRFGCV